MQKFRKNTLVIIGIIMLLLLSACSGADQTSVKKSGKKVIGISLQNFSDEFRTYMIDAMKEEQKKYPNVEFIYSDAQNDSSKQMNQIENFITQKVDAIIFTPVDTVAAVDILAKVNASALSFPIKHLTGQIKLQLMSVLSRSNPV
jgi:inositol transport system substrate-binding protein